jgi:hypothetical protein
MVRDESGKQQKSISCPHTIIRPETLHGVLMGAAASLWLVQVPLISNDMYVFMKTWGIAKRATQKKNACF